MLTSNKNNFSEEDWKPINMRNVEHLLGVEFIHDLYNRYEPKINALRFRNTVTIWKDGTVRSFAPRQEWEQIGEIVGIKYYLLDKFTIEQTKKLYSRRRLSFHKFIKSLQDTNLSVVSNEHLFALLVDFQSIVLGELYVLNFIQVEHGLNTAVKKIMAEIFPHNNVQEEVFVKLIRTEILTNTQKEQKKLYYIAKKWKFLRKVALYNRQKAKNEIKKHCNKYKWLYSAYGESPKNFQSFWDTFQKYLSSDEKPPRVPWFPKILDKDSKVNLKKINNKKLNVLIPLIVQGGIFRDDNKALLGMSLKYRFAMLDEIASRSDEKRGNLNYYLLSELISLLRYSKKINLIEIKKRKKEGVVFTREEKFKINAKEIFQREIKKSKNNVLSGQCASQGECYGKCKIVLTKKDISKVKDGDIMIAIGTDFDLIEAMYRSAAVITEEGGVLSHASVVCREINKPCCIGVENVTTLLKDGQKIRVNATKGKIYLD